MLILSTSEELNAEPTLKTLGCNKLIRKCKFLISEFNPLSANPKKWSNTLKQFVGNLFECF